MTTQEEVTKEINEHLNLANGKKREITIVAPTEIVEEMERIAYEKNAREHVIDRLFEKHQNDADGGIIDSEPFKHFMAKLAEVLAEEELMMNKISKEVIPESLQEHSIQWNLDFATHELKVTIVCDCEIEGLDEITH